MVEAAILTCRWLGLLPTHPSQRYGFCLRRIFMVNLPHGREIQRALGDSKPVAEVYTAARAVEWLIHLIHCCMWPVRLRVDSRCWRWFAKSSHFINDNPARFIHSWSIRYAGRIKSYHISAATLRQHLLKKI